MLHRPVFVYRGDVDDPAATALLDHLLGSELSPEKRAFQIDREHLVILRLRRIEHRSARLDARIIDHDIETAEFLDGGVHQVPQVGNLADVGIDANRLRAQHDDLFLQGFGRIRMRDIVDDDIGALPDQLEHDRHANAAVATGDDGDFPL